MEDRDFLLEKMRRDAQELVNACDEAIADEGDDHKHKDTMVCIRVVAVSADNSDFMEKVLGIESKKEGS